MKLLKYTQNSNPFMLLLALLNVKYTKSYINKLYNEHPHKYNMYGLSNMLAKYNVDSEGVRLNDKKLLQEVETPFIAHYGNGFITVYKLTKERIHYNWKGKNITIPIDNFYEIWSGVLLIPEASKKSIEPNYIKNKKEELLKYIQIGILILSLVLVGLIACFSVDLMHNGGLLISLLINIVGVYTGYLLLEKQLKIQSDFADKICSLFKQGDCNDILESPAAKFMGIISWSEIGFSYFLSNIGIILFLPQLIPCMVIINICALPYSFWSIWYQKVKVGQWCPLCIIVQILFWIQAIVFIFFGLVQFPVINYFYIILVGCVYAIPLLTTNILIPIITGNRKLTSATQEMNSLKMKNQVFEALLKDETYYNIDKTVSQIIWGNPEANILISVLTNPHCEPCARMHKKIKILLEKLGDKICVQYIFSSFNKELDISNRFLIHTYLNKDSNEAIAIYDDWFDNGKYTKELFFSDYAFYDEYDDQTQHEFVRHNLWKESHGLSATPTVFINGYELPYFYKLEELEYFL